MSEARLVVEPQIDEGLLNEIVQGVFGWTLEEMFSGPYGRELTSILADILNQDGFSARALASYHPEAVEGLTGAHYLVRALKGRRSWLLDPSWRLVARQMGIDRRGLPGLVVVENVDMGNAPDVIAWSGDHDLEWPPKLKDFMLEMYKGVFRGGADSLRAFENRELARDVAKAYIGATAVNSAALQN
jgi:hypothetical protein